MISIIDYKAGNLTSVKLALDNLGAASEITNNTEQILNADKVIFPGDGAAESAMEHLRELDLIDSINEVVSRKIPFLGICLGTQIIFGYSEENNGIECINLIPGKVKQFVTANSAYKIPQMGWNTVKFKREHPVFEGIENESEFYFIHSFYPSPSNPDHILGETEYADVCFASIVGRQNLIATQFHPERSGRIGLKLLDNFIKWDGIC